MTSIAARLQGPRNHGTVIVAFSVLAAFSQLAARTLTQCDWFFSLSGEQLVRVLPVTSLCEMLVCWLPAGARLLTGCPWINLAGSAIRLLCGAM